MQKMREFQLISVLHPAIVKAVKFSMKIADDTLTNNVLYKDYLASKNIGDKVVPSWFT